MKERNLLVLLLIILFTGVLFQQSAKQTEKPIRIKKIKNLKTNSAANYTYDTLGRILSVSSSTGITETYFYANNFIIRKTRSASSTSADYDTLFPGKTGTVYYSVNRSNGLISNTGYKYENDFLTESKTYINGSFEGTHIWVIADDNQISTTYVTSEGKKSNTVYFFYYPEKYNSIGNVNLGMNFLGRNSRNLIRESIGLNSDGDTISHLIYSYGFDSKNRVTLKMTKYKSGVVADSIGYLYVD